MRRPSLIATLALALVALPFPFPFPLPAAAPNALAGAPQADPQERGPKKAEEAQAKQAKRKAAVEKPAASPQMRARIAAFALRQTEFGAISLLPVRFEKSRLAGPFEDGGRQLYCVSSRMKGRSLSGYERAKVIIRDANGVLTRLDEDEEVCEGHRTEPFPELEAAVRD